METNKTDDPRQRLLAAAGEVFAEKGFEGATVREICQLAEVNIAAVNYYFRDKESLYIEAVKECCRSQNEKFPLPEWPMVLAAPEKLRIFIRTLVSRMLDPQLPPWHRRLFLREMAQPSRACAELVQNQIRPSATMLGQILEELLPEAPERQRYLIAFSIVGQCLFHRIAQPIVSLLVGEEEYRSYDPQLLADHIAHFSLAALGLNPPALVDAGARKSELAGRK
jgi:AcrR family transcriptional regulator